MGVRLPLKVVWAISVSWPVSKVSVLIVCWVTETVVSSGRSLVRATRGVVWCGSSDRFGVYGLLPPCRHFDTALLERRSSKTRAGHLPGLGGNIVEICQVKRQQQILRLSWTTVSLHTDIHHKHQTLRGIDVPNSNHVMRMWWLTCYSVIYCDTEHCTAKHNYPVLAICICFIFKLMCYSSTLHHLSLWKEIHFLYKEYQWLK